MSRKTRRSEKRREKRFAWVLTLLEASNADPKRNNRKTRLREMLNIARADFHATYANMGINADQA